MKDSLELRRCSAFNYSVNWPQWRYCSRWVNDATQSSVISWNRARGHAIRAKGIRTSDAGFEELYFARRMPWAAGRGTLN